MLIRLKHLFIAAALAGITACTATVTAPRLVVTDVVVARPPPPMRMEPLPPPPSAHPEMFVWQPGHWHWNGHDYEWKRGHYERRPSQAAAWVPPEWVARDGQWVFHPGHWVYH